MSSADESSPPQGGRPPSPQKIWERAHLRYHDDAEFHARVHAAAQLLGNISTHLIVATVHAADLATEMLSLSRDMRTELASGVAARRLGTGELRFDSVSLVAHVKREGCIDLDEAHPVCPGCGVGFVMLLDEQTLTRHPERYPHEPGCPYLADRSVCTCFFGAKRG